MYPPKFENLNIKINNNIIYNFNIALKPLMCHTFRLIHFTQTLIVKKLINSMAKSDHDRDHDTTNTIATIFFESTDILRYKTGKEKSKKLKVQQLEKQALQAQNLIKKIFLILLCIINQK